MKDLKVFIRTYGCQMNERDSENIAADCLKRGMIVTDNEAQADIIIVNTCSVREQAERKAMGKLGHAIDSKKANSLPIVGVTGCMAQNKGASIAQTFPQIDFIAGSRKLHNVVDMALEMYKKRAAGIMPPQFPKNKKNKKVDTLIDVSDDLDSHRLINLHDYTKKQVCAYVSIMQGCQMNCTYCIVPKVRGIQRSRPINEVLDEIKALADNSDTKEITLLGQVVNAYGRDFTNYENKSRAFVDLLEKISEIDSIKRIRFTSPHPAFFNDALINAYADLPKLCEYVHLPLQSGDNRILKEMHRPYTQDKFIDIAHKLREKSPNISISTDIIVGYPSETDAEFENTVKTFKECNFDMAYIFKYSPREGTASAQKIDDIPEEIKEYRNQILLEELRKQSLSFNEKLIGTKQEILVEAKAKRGDNFYMGRTRTHRKTIFQADPSAIGKMLNVEIQTASVSTMTAISLSDF